MMIKSKGGYMKIKYVSLLFCLSACGPTTAQKPDAHSIHQDPAPDAVCCVAQEQDAVCCAVPMGGYAGGNAEVGGESGKGGSAGGAAGQDGSDTGGYAGCCPFGPMGGYAGQVDLDCPDGGNPAIVDGGFGCITPVCGKYTMLAFVGGYWGCYCVPGTSMQNIQPNPNEDYDVCQRCVLSTH